MIRAGIAAINALKDDTLKAARVPDLASRRGLPFAPTHWVRDPGADPTREIPVMLVDGWAFTHAEWESGEQPAFVSSESGWRTVGGAPIKARGYDPTWRPRVAQQGVGWRRPYPHEIPDFGPFVPTHDLLRGTEPEQVMAFGDLAYTADAWALGKPPSYIFDLDSGDVVVREWPDGAPLDPSTTSVVPLSGLVHDYAGWRDQWGRPHIALVDVGGLIPVADLEWLEPGGGESGVGLQLATVLLDGTLPEYAADYRVRRAVLGELTRHTRPIGPWTVSGQQVRQWGLSAAEVPEIHTSPDPASLPFLATHRLPRPFVGDVELMVHARMAFTFEMWEGAGEGGRLHREPGGPWRTAAPMMGRPPGRDLEPLPTRYVGLTGGDGMHYAVRICDGDLRELRGLDGSAADWSTPAGRRVLAAEMAADAIVNASYGSVGGDGRWRVATFERLLEALAAANGHTWELPAASLTPWLQAQESSFVAALHADAPRAPLDPSREGLAARPASSPPAPPPLSPPVGPA